MSPKYRLILLTFTTVICLWTCQKQDKKENQPLVKNEVAKTIQNDLQIINQNVFLDSIPSVLTFNKSEYVAFYNWWRSSSIGNWANLQVTQLDSIYTAKIVFKPGFQFIKTLYNPESFRYESSHVYGIMLRCITEDSYDDLLNLPMVRSTDSKRLFNVMDSVFLVYSYNHYVLYYTFQELNIRTHIFYNHKEGEYLLKTLDTLGNVISSSTLFHTSKDPTICHSVYIPSESCVQIIEHRKEYSQTSKYPLKSDSTEIKRFFIDSLGRILDWNIKDPDYPIYFAQLPQDSIISSHREYSIGSIPLQPVPLLRQREIFNILSKKEDYFKKFDLNPFPLLCYQHLITSTPGTMSYTVVDANGENVFLILSDVKDHILDVKDLNPLIRRPDGNWINTSARLDNMHRIAVYNKHEIKDILGWIIVEPKLLRSTIKKEPLLTFPVSNIDTYFSFFDQKVFFMDSIEKYSHSGQLKQFSDSVLTCISEVMEQNGGFFKGKNYCINYPSNGLTYLITYGGGHYLESGVQMYILNKENVLLNEYLGLASHGGDEGDTWKSWGYFRNDSTYVSTSLNCVYESHCDSTISVIHIKSNGKWLEDSNQTKSFRRPYN